MQDEWEPKKLTVGKLKVPSNLLWITSFYRYLFELGRESSEVPDPNKEAVIHQWVEWESASLQVCFYVGGEPQPG